MPSASTVASDMALGLTGSLLVASSSHAANSRKGSSASVKLPLVNQFGCSIGAVSDIFQSCIQVASQVAARASRRFPSYSGTPAARLRRPLGTLAAILTLGLCG